MQLPALITSLSPSAALEAERRDLDEQIARLDGKIEDLRLEAARLPHVPGFEGEDRDRQVLELHRRRDARRAERKALSRRRREIDEKLRPVSAAETALAGVKKPKALVKAEKGLADARSRYLRLVADGRADGGEVVTRKLLAELNTVEAEIAALRREVVAQRPAFYADVRQALTPVVEGAAERLSAATRAQLAEIETLTEVAGYMPGPAPGVSPAVAQVAYLNRAAVAAIQGFAEMIAAEVAVVNDEAAA
jgi:hypothetical protein